MSSPGESKSKITSPSYTQDLLDAVPTGIIVSDQKGQITYANAESERLFGYKRSELVGQTIDMLLPDRFSHHHAQLRESYTVKPTPRYMGAGRELYGKRKDSSEFPLEIGLRPLLANNENLVVATIVDISQRKRLEERFARVIEASPYGKLLVDSQGVIQLINPSLLNLFGYTKEELLGQTMDLLLPERYRHDHHGHREKYMQNPSLRAMGAGRDLTGRHKNGTEIPIEIGLSPVDTDNGTMILAAVTDITERKRLELDIKQANAHLEEFTYVASHDLKSPLRGISDLAEWISEDMDSNTPASIRKNIDRIKIRINRMEQLVDDLLIYARAGKRAGESTQINVAALIASIIELQPVPESFSIIQRIDIDFIQAARTPLETVLRNLFSNALKHHHGINPRIEIHAEAEGSYCVFSVIDNGPGIPEAAHERVFRLFQTLTATERAGSGIGLALAKRLTESHGGRVELINQEGVPGAFFRVWWPRFPRRDIDE
ncbi:MAG: PAS domain-containing sensor histidine kinase [Pseudomonadota bacterium]